MNWTEWYTINVTQAFGTHRDEPAERTVARNLVPLSGSGWSNAHPTSFETCPRNWTGRVANLGIRQQTLGGNLLSDAPFSWVLPSQLLVVSKMAVVDEVLLPVCCGDRQDSGGSRPVPRVRRLRCQ